MTLNRDQGIGAMVILTPVRNWKTIGYAHVAAVPKLFLLLIYKMEPYFKSRIFTFMGSLLKGCLYFKTGIKLQNFIVPKN